MEARLKLHLYRQPSEVTSTIGDLYINGVWQCYVLEDVVRKEKIPGETAIPAGTYHIGMHESARVKAGKLWSPEPPYLPILRDVPGFSGILIHSGNTDRDTSGCLLVGLRRGNESVSDSRAALREIFPRIRAAVESGEEVTITVEAA